jgi:hypothetical protein
MLLCLRQGPLILAKLLLGMEIEFAAGFDPQPTSTGPVQKPGCPMMVSARRR